MANANTRTQTSRLQEFQQEWLTLDCLQFTVTPPFSPFAGARHVPSVRFFCCLSKSHETIDVFLNNQFTNTKFGNAADQILTLNFGTISPHFGTVSLHFGTVEGLQGFFSTFWDTPKNAERLFSTLWDSVSTIRDNVSTFWDGL